MPLFAFGSNGSGQLGIGHVDDVSEPTRCVFEEEEPNPTSQSGKTIVRVAAGGNHTLVLHSDGAVYAAGCNEDRRCGASFSSDAQVRFRRLIIVEDEVSGQTYRVFKHVAATWEGTILVVGAESARGGGYENDDAHDKVFVVGSGAKGELGLGEECTRASTPVQIPDFPPLGTKIDAIASGMGHAVVVLSNGDVYGWGGARKGQLGDYAKAGKIAWSPVKIEGLNFRATDAACGREFTVLTGDKATGQFVVLGSCDNKWNILSSAPASDHVMGFRGIAASWHGVYVHQVDFSVVAWGRNDRGQLPPANIPKARELAVGSEHALVLVDGRTVVAFGWGEHGNCGPVTDAHGNVKEDYRLIPLPSEAGSEIVGVGAGCATSWIVMS
ncbi:hypothetical protein FE257_010053 [Aspergillus nanangensis]|uniref:RCC1-like domain-containing protein n=1 Tax=Aspergillus nanangensis TaxID=2582783 RepID=A0AAD4CY19_ASPNN|nr:hypothetical protein FE257_010053 [Aspergillus nanangensis]